MEVSGSNIFFAPGAQALRQSLRSTLMRLSVAPFRHPDYSALRGRSETLALVWGVGHLVFVLFLAFALIVPFGVAMVAAIDSEVTSQCAWNAITSGVSATLLIAALGFGARFLAAKKGKLR